jgi:hypothetical protein
MFFGKLIRLAATNLYRVVKRAASPSWWAELQLVLP